MSSKDKNNNKITTKSFKGLIPTIRKLAKEYPLDNNFISSDWDDFVSKLKPVK